MPHRCMECKNVLESGELDLNTGCPVCGSKKFQYMRPAKKEPKDSGKLATPGHADGAPTAEAGHEAPGMQKDAPKHKVAKVDKAPAAEPAGKEKKHAHERIESVRILEKGNYDINLPVLLSRKELVMSKEEGVYVVDLPSALKAPKEKKTRAHRK